MTITAVREYNVKGFNLSVTARDAGDAPEVMEELIFRTVAAWLYLAELIERNIFEVKTTGSIEARYIMEKETTLSDTWQDSRVTVWSTYRGQKNPQFHLNSDDDMQRALNTYLANRTAQERIYAKYNEPAPQNASNPAQDAQQAVSTPTQVSSPTPQPFTQQQAIASQNPIALATHGVTPVQGKQGAKALPLGSQFSMRIVKIAAGMSKKGTPIYELFAPYGGKAGEWSDLIVYSDNPVAIAKGVVAKLDTLGLKAGNELTGDWFVVGNVYSSNGKVGLNVEQVEEYQK